jgi:hypothetical protein
VRALLDHREVIGWVLLVTMLFFSSLGFKVLENVLGAQVIAEYERIDTEGPKPPPGVLAVGSTAGADGG